MKLAFSIRNEVNLEKVIKDINKLVEKYLNSGNSREEGIISIEIVKATYSDEIKNLESNA